MPNERTFRTAGQPPSLGASPTGDTLSPWAIGTATIMNAALLALLILLEARAIGPPPPSAAGADLHFRDFPLFAPPSARITHGGGGSAARDRIDAMTGRTPKQAIMPLLPPQIPVIEHPKLAIEPAIAVPLEIKLPDNPTLPNLGIHLSPNVELASSGPGGYAGIGSSSKGGDGPGNGDGYGPGSGKGFGGSIYSPGVGGVSKPIAIVAPEAEFSEEARRQHYQGVCIVAIIVDAQGNPRDPKVTRSLGLGLDEKALEAVQKYRFKPATKGGKPVASYVSIEIDFHLY